MRRWDNKFFITAGDRGRLITISAGRLVFSLLLHKVFHSEKLCRNDAILHCGRCDSSWCEINGPQTFSVLVSCIREASGVQCSLNYPYGIKSAVQPHLKADKLVDVLFTDSNDTLCRWMTMWERSLRLRREERRNPLGKYLHSNMIIKWRHLETLHKEQLVEVFRFPRGRCVLRRVPAQIGLKCDTLTWPAELKRCRSKGWK